MNEIPIPEFERAIRATHGAKSRLLYREHVIETFRDKPIWTGEVLVFELLDHPTSAYCYAWEVDGKVTVVLHEPPVDSASAAVRAAIVHEHLEKKS